MSTIQERRQDANAKTAINEHAYNRQVLRMFGPGHEYRPFYAKKQAAVLRTIVNLGPITIEEVRTKTGAIKYKFTARTVKLATEKEYKQIIRLMRKALTPDGILPESKYWLAHREEDKARKRTAYAENKETINAARRAKWAENREEINRRRREKAETLRALKAAMQTLSEKTL